MQDAMTSPVLASSEASHRNTLLHQNVTNEADCAPLGQYNCLKAMRVFCDDDCQNAGAVK
jgi:hypothetical protein